VYIPFFEYRRRLPEIVSSLRAGSSIGQEEINGLVEISTPGLKDKMLALGTAMKDDPGGYMTVVIQVPS